MTALDAFGGRRFIARSSRGARDVAQRLSGESLALRPRQRPPAVLGGQAIRRVIVLAITCGLALGCRSGPTVGTMPPPGPDGVVSASAIPDYVAVAGPNGGIAGYVESRFLTGPPTSARIPVFARDLTTLVGYMWPGIGFIALNADPSGVRTPVSTAAAATFVPSGGHAATLTVFVRNAGAIDRWIATIVNGQIAEAQGYSGVPGVGCLASPIGTQLVVLSGSPGADGTHPIGTIRIQSNSQPTTLWIDFTAPGPFSFGPGVPDWWTDSGDPCP